MAKRLITKVIGEVLLERGVVSRDELEKGLAYQRKHGGLMGQALIQLGFVTEEEVALALTAQYGFPYLPLTHYEIDADLIALIPEPIARQYCLIAVDRIGNALTLAMADPSNTQAIAEIEMLTTCVVQAFVSTPSDINKAIETYYKRAASAHPPSGTTEAPHGNPSSMS
ncbi:MAG: hypothetical protein HYY58_05105 [Candidatus Omnitrophica bacterium]|nr:hypothetical protein [Candidatus Omnitrophota bacterium]